jgi:protein SCO1/2
MANIGQALRQFETAAPERAAQVTPIFVTVDPLRDTPDAIKPFVNAFHPRFVGLTGDEPAVQAAMKRYGIYARRVDTRESSADADYLVDHFAVYYLFGPNGEPVAFVPHGSGVDAVRGMLETYVR